MGSAATIGHFSLWEPGLFSLFVYTFLVLATLAAMLFLAGRLGSKDPTDEKLRPYESGVIPTVRPPLRFPIPYFQIAVFFLIFDLENVFLFAWAVAAGRLGWPGWLQISGFILVLLFILLYLWKKGGLDWTGLGQEKA